MVSKTKRFKALLEIGYFPEELPPPFSTRDLAAARNSVAKAWGKILGDYPKSHYEVFSIPRIKRGRRYLAIVNPMAQVPLAKLIADEWVTIRKHLAQSRYAIEIPEIRTDQSRAVPAPDFGLLALRRSEIAAAYDHVLISDISRFYGTLYTHAIPWALHSKVWCKKHLAKKAIYDPTLGARLDRATRKGQDNQTIGIPVGPDTSRIISEIVAAGIDMRIQSALKLDTANAFRHVDDWYIGFDTSSEAEGAVAELVSGCREFELELSSEKTSTLRSTASIDRIWASELRQFQFGVLPNQQARSLEHYFAKTFEYAARSAGENVFDYAIKRSVSITVHTRNWRAYETFLLQGVRFNGTILPTAAQIFVSYNTMQYPLDRLRISKLIEDLIRVHARSAHHSEVAWALYLAKALKIKLSKAAVRAVEKLESSVCALLALDLERNGLLAVSADKVLWKQSMNGDGLRSPMWLLAYEADLKKWLLSPTPDFVDQHPFFSVLKNKNVSFYDPNKTAPDIMKSAPKPVSVALQKFLEQYEGTKFAAGPEFSMVGHG